MFQCFNSFLFYIFLQFLAGIVKHLFSVTHVSSLVVAEITQHTHAHSHIVFPNLRERLGDAKEQVREQAQTLTQQILQDVVSSPQLFLDKLLESCFSHKNWRVKEQGLLCLSRTLS